MCEKEGKPLPLRGTASRAPCGNKSNGVFFQSKGRCLFRVGLQCWFRVGLRYSERPPPLVPGWTTMLGWPGPKLLLVWSKKYQGKFQFGMVCCVPPLRGWARRCSRCPAFTFNYYNTQSRIDKKKHLRLSVCRMYSGP